MESAWMEYEYCVVENTPVQNYKVAKMAKALEPAGIEPAPLGLRSCLCAGRGTWKSRVDW